MGFFWFSGLAPFGDAKSRCGVAPFGVAKSRSAAFSS